MLDDDEDFDWLSYYRAQYAEAVTEEKIKSIANEYKGSEQEKQDLLAAYTRFKGNLARVYGHVMLSDILEDDDRFRDIINKAIEEDEVESFPAYEKETDESREKAKEQERKRRAKFDEKVAAKESAKGKSKGKTGKAAASDSLADLAALIQNRQRARAGNLFAGLEERYAQQSGRKRGAPSDGPPEEAFAKNAKKLKKAKESRKKKQVASDDEEDEDEIDLEKDSNHGSVKGDGDEDDEEFAGFEEEEERPKPKKKRARRGGSAKKAAKRAAK